MLLTIAFYTLAGKTKTPGHPYHYLSELYINGTLIFIYVYTSNVDMECKDGKRYTKLDNLINESRNAKVKQIGCVFNWYQFEE